MAIETNLPSILLSRHFQFRMPGVLNNLGNSIGMPRDGEGVALIVSRQEWLQQHMWPASMSPTRPARPMMMKANLAAKLLSRLSKFNLQGVRINSSEPNGLLIVDKDVKFTISKQSSLSPPRFGTKREVCFQPRISATKRDARIHELRVSAPKHEVRVQPQAEPKRENARPMFSLRPRQNMTLACESR